MFNFQTFGKWRIRNETLIITLKLHRRLVYDNANGSHDKITHAFEMYGINNGQGNIPNAYDAMGCIPSIPAAKSWLVHIKSC